MEEDTKAPMFSESERLRLQGVFLDFWILLKQCERELQNDSELENPKNQKD